ncbi:MAG: FtsW/RodA/SpoVE family cell cycle protein [Fusobacteriaceae bacterium]
MSEKNIYYQRNKIEKETEMISREIRAKRRTRNIVLTLIFLFFLSLLNIYSASFYNVGMGNRYLMAQAKYFILGGTLTILVYRFLDYRVLQKKNIPKFLLLGCMLVLAAIPPLANVLPNLVPKINGAIGWIKVPGIGSVQPAEIFKVPFVILMSHRLSMTEKSKDKNLKYIIMNSGILIIFSLLIILQNDLGTIIHYTCIFIFMVFMGNIELKWIGKIAASIVSFVVLVMGYIHNIDISTGGYKILRVKSFLNGLINDVYDQDKGYQVGQSLIGFGRGKILGAGYGNGIQKYSYLPEIHTDFILTSFGEEFGFVGLIALILLFLALFNLLKSVGNDCEDSFGRYLAVGISGYIFIQFLINISVAIGILPVFGIPMPIMSYGGSSLLTIFLAIGIVLSVNKRIVKNKI